ncbi:unnamed protein product [Taenia asiatica]|uniref:Kinesin motor domain-containing protein n=1 Tax=Taenia asiatica TaxID=60517 RepID=A0A0R3WG66_TAEAS|nr:unnamed protein product [Taenia asiatica]
MVLNAFTTCITRMQELSREPDPQTALTTIEESKIRINGSSRRLRFEELVSIPDAEWLPNFDRSVYQLSPVHSFEGDTAIHTRL